MFEQEVVIIVLKLHIIFVESELLDLFIDLIYFCIDLINDVIVFGFIVKVLVVRKIILAFLHDFSINFDFYEV